MPQSVVISCVDNLPGKASLAEGGWWKERGGLVGGKGGGGRWIGRKLSISLSPASFLRLSSVSEFTPPYPFQSASTNHRNHDSIELRECWNTQPSLVTK